MFGVVVKRYKVGTIVATNGSRNQTTLHGMEFVVVRQFVFVGLMIRWFTEIAKEIFFF